MISDRALLCLALGLNAADGLLTAFWIGKEAEGNPVARAVFALGASWFLAWKLAAVSPLILAVWAFKPKWLKPVVAALAAAVAYTTIGLLFLP